MSHLENYYNEHVAQARQHEEQRDKATNLVLGITGALIGLITYSEMSWPSMGASLMIVFLGIYGFLFAGKHYECFRRHSTIAKFIRDEMDRLRANPNPDPPEQSLNALRQAAQKKHYETFRWPSVRGDISAEQASATSWIARQRLHVFWETVHLLIALIGLALTIAITIKARHIFG